MSLSTLLRAHATAAVGEAAAEALSPQALVKIMGLCRLLNVLVVVRGYKTGEFMCSTSDLIELLMGLSSRTSDDPAVVKFFPHEAQDLERVLSVFVAVKAQGVAVKSAEDGIAIWESQSILMLWLSMLILVPFDLATIDSTATDAASRALPYTQLVSRLLVICQDCIHQPG